MAVGPLSFVVKYNRKTWCNKSQTNTNCIMCIWLDKKERTLLNKNPTTSELLSYRRKENDSLRRFFLDKTNYISKSIKLLDKSLKLPTLETLTRKSGRSNSFEGKNQHHDGDNNNNN